MSAQAEQAIADLRRRNSMLSERLKSYANNIEVRPGAFTPADIAEVLRHTARFLEVFDQVLADAEMKESET